MAKIDKTYQELLTTILEDGYKYMDPNRKGVQRTELMDYTLEHDFQDGFPAITLKKLAWKTVIGELLFFVRGQRNLKHLHDNKVAIWDKDGYNRYVKRCEDENWLPALPFEEWLAQVKYKPKEVWETGIKHRFCSGDLGPIYGVQWRDFYGEADQLAELIYNLKYNPMSTQMIVSAWNPCELDDMALPPCHYEFQVVARPLKYVERVKVYGGYIHPDMKITEKDMDAVNTPTHGIKLIWSQRSVDTFLGLPFNIASYAALTCLLAKMSNTVPLGIKANLKNVHLYSNSIKEAYDLTRLPYDTYGESVLDLNARELEDLSDLNRYLDELKVKDFYLLAYDSFDAKRVEMLARDQ